MTADTGNVRTNKESADSRPIPASPELIRATELGAVLLQDNGFDDGDFGVGNASSVRRYRAVARPLIPGEPLNREQPIPWHEEVIACVFFFFVFGSYLWVPISLIVGLCVVPWRWLAACVTTALLLSRLLPWKMEPPLVFPLWLRQILFRYFSLLVILPGEKQLCKGRKYIFAGAPHGVIPMGDVLSFQLAPLGHIQGLGAPAVLSLPLMGNLLGSMGIVSCAKASATRVLASGRSLGLMPGGIAEIFELRPDREVAYLHSRKGFVRLALTTGACLVPCYSLGTSELYQCFTGRWLQNLSKKLRASVTLFWGRFFLPIPYRRPVCCLVGDPIELPTIEDPSQDEVDNWHKVFCDRMVGLFETHRHAFGWSQKELCFT
eukprot:TRINITY_DN31440_c0_g1_i1.p1 TRINITY_DN31440_c0_g1~~TRINITY_DN31440_c0_g1_i1.p1  ORF type:complete len:400 (+),score=46.04 TRINITY_DN31440_c0_g1_i1:72-1202(+)